MSEQNKKQSDDVDELIDAMKSFGQEFTIEFVLNKKPRKEKWRVISPIRDSPRYNTPFIGTLGGLNASAITLSFYGRRFEVC